MDLSVTPAQLVPSDQSLKVLGHASNVSVMGFPKNVILNLDGIGLRPRIGLRTVSQPVTGRLQARLNMMSKFS